MPIVGCDRRKDGGDILGAIVAVQAVLAVPRTFPGILSLLSCVPALHHRLRGAPHPECGPRRAVNHAQEASMWSMLVDNAGAVALVLIAAVGVAAAIGAILDRYVD